MASVLHGLIAGLTRASSASHVTAQAWRHHRSAYCVSFIRHDRGTVTKQPVQFTFSRNASFVGKVTANELWGGVYGVSNAGRKRGRAKRGRKQMDLNRGQIVGVGKTNMVWPGLNAPVIKGREMMSIKKLPKDQERESKIREIRDRGSGFRTFKVPALQRGWTGGKFAGISLGPPDPVGDYTFEGFDSRVIEFKLVTNMTGNLGRKQRFSSFVVTGNKNGLAGFGLAKAPSGKASLRKAKNMAAQRLRYIERYQDSTVFHNFYSKEKQTAVFVYKAAKALSGAQVSRDFPLHVNLLLTFDSCDYFTLSSHINKTVKKSHQGSGLVCHRAIKTICELIGIEDLRAKVEGSTSNVQNLTKAFFKGLQRQETHQELADRMKLNVVEFRPELDYVPVVVAKPEEGKTHEEGIKEEGFTFETLYYGGKVPLYRPKPDPFYVKFRSWRIKKRFLMTTRNQRQAQLKRLALGIEPSLEERKFRAKPLR